MTRRAALAVVLAVVALLSTTASTSGRLVQSGTQSNQGPRTTVLWSAADVGNLPRISPDGRMLAYIDRNPPSVGIRDLTTGTNRILVRSVSETAREIVSESAGEVVFSADGNRVAYSWAKHREDRYELRITPVRDGGSVRVVTTMARGASIRVHDWSKDGTWIAVERTASSAATSAEYVVVNVEDGTSRVVKTVEAPAPTSRLVFSPDGRYLAYDRPATIDTDQHDVFVVSLDTGADTAHVASPADATVAGWSPDGRYLLFTSEEGGTVNLRGQPMVNGSPDGPARTFQTGIEGTPVGVTATGGVAMMVTADPATICRRLPSTLDGRRHCR